MPEYATFQELAYANSLSCTEQHQELVECFMNLYKTLNGVKPRWMNFAEFTVEELVSMCESLGKVVDAEEKRIAQEQEEAIRTALIHGAPNRKVAERWLKQADRY